MQRTVAFKTIQSCIPALSFAAVGLISVWQKKFVTDDGYIYFRYIDNFALHKIGLVFNAGEKVEGFTGPLWVLFLSGLRYVFQSASLNQIISIVGMIAALAAFLLMIRTNRAVLQYSCPESFDTLFDFSLPLVLSISTAVITDFFTSGLETPLLMLFAAFTADQILLPKKNVWRVGALCALGPLVRPECLLVSGMLMLHYLLFIGSGVRLLKIAALFAVTNLCALLLRIWYYAALLPNTYYAKAGSGLYLSQGLKYLHDLNRAYHSDIVLLSLLLLILVFRFTAMGAATRRLFPNRIFLLLVMLVYGLYVVAVGGDFMHGRFFLPVLVFLYMATAGLLEPVLLSTSAKLNALERSAAGFVVMLLVFVVFSSFESVQQGIRRSYGIEDIRKMHESMNFGYLSTWNARLDNSLIRRGKRYRNIARSSDIRVAAVVGSAGYRGYFAGPSVTIIDDYGITDPVVARLRLEKRGYPGHEKRAPFPYVLYRRPVFAKTPYDDYNAALYIMSRSQPLLDLRAETLEALDRFLINKDVTSAVHRAIVALLDRHAADPDFVFMLSHMCSGSCDAEITQKLAEAQNAVKGPSSYERWLDDHRERLELIDAMKRNKHTLRENFRIALKAHRIRFDPL